MCAHSLVLKIEMEKHKIECADLKKCGEITTQLSIGKREFFLNCSFCDYTFLQLGDFIQHICEDHMCQFTNPKVEDEAEYSLELQVDMDDGAAQFPTADLNEVMCGNLINQSTVVHYIPPFNIIFLILKFLIEEI